MGNIEGSAYHYITKYRLEIMGLAICWVVLFHSDISFDFVSNAIGHSILQFLKDVGYGGVDIFLFLSGIGIFHSLSNHNVSTYFANRIKRIIPSWYVFMSIFVCIGFIMGTKYSVEELLGIITLTGFWTNMANQGNWYVYGIFFIYLISPVLYYLIVESRNRRKTCAVLIIVSFLVSFVYFNQPQLILFTRMPVYIFGMHFAATTGNNGVMQKKDWCICASFMSGGLLFLLCAYFYFIPYLWKYGLWWYPFLFIAPSLSLLLSRLLDIARKENIFFRLLRRLGESSFEILLSSDFVFFFLRSPRLRISGNLLEMVLIFLGVILGLIAHVILEKMKGYVAGIIML